MTAAAGPTAASGQALDIKRTSPRLTWSDAIVLVGAVALVLLGAGIKRLHDGRMVERQAGAITVAYPRGWYPLPATEPQLLRVGSDEGGATLMLFAEPTTQTDIFRTSYLEATNPAGGETAFTQLSNEPTTIDGHDALRTDYGYVRTTIGNVALPQVIQGRQYAWIQDGQLYALVLEAPAEEWDEVSGAFNRIVDGMKT